MCTMRLPAACLVLLVLAVPSRAQDLRDQFSTQSLEAAQAIQKAIGLAQAKKPREALVAIDSAVKADPACQMAHYWRGNILVDCGEIEGGLDAFKKALSDEVRRAPRLSAGAANNLALTLGRLKEYEEACLWFTRAVVEDSDNRFKERGKAYRNLAITLRHLERHMGAAMAVAMAYEDKNPTTSIKMVQEFFQAIRNQEAGRLLHFAEAVPKLAKRGQKGDLMPLTVAGIDEPIHLFLPDPEGRWVLAWPKKSDHYYLIEADSLQARKVDLPSVMDHPCLAEGQLYAAAVNPSTIHQIDPSSGKTARTFSLKAHVPSSLAVLPTQDRAYFCVDRVVHELHLKTSAIRQTSIPGQLVLAHPGQQFVFSLLKPERSGGGSGHIIVNGRPIFFHTGVTDWLQAVVFKAHVVPTGLLLAEVRDSAASNAARVSLSPDGNWIAVAGGGGWRPSAKEQGFGYGVAVFAGANLEHVQGFFKTDAYPTGVCFNPVTQQVAALRGKDAKVYHLSDANDFVEIKGKFSGVSAWSGHGKHLFLANEGGGVLAFANTLTAAEEKVATLWYKNLVVKPLPGSASVVAAKTSFAPAAGFDKFAVLSPSVAELAKVVASVIASQRSDRPGPWQDYPPYQNEVARKAIDEATEHLGNKDEAGLALFKIRKALKAQADSVPLQFFLGESLRRANQPDEAEKAWLETVRRDQGRTNLSCLALNGLGTISAEKNNPQAALHCFTASLQLDRANPHTIALTVPLLKKHNLAAEADRLARQASGSPQRTAVLDLPPLPLPGPGKKQTASEIYQKAAASVVLIKTTRGSGSGVCIARGDLVVTNDHVVTGEESVEVYTFTLKDKVPLRMPMVKAQVIYRSAKEDLALLKLEKAPDHLLPMPVAAASPSPGDKVYSLGSPGLGADVLEQTISEGLVSSKNRLIDGATYIQHSAPVNPGNSGGALLDEEGRVAGIVTLNARLANVSFAIPPEVLRRLFPAAKETAKSLP